MNEVKELYVRAGDRREALYRNTRPLFGCTRAMASSLSKLLVYYPNRHPTYPPGPVDCMFSAEERLVKALSVLQYVLMCKPVNDKHVNRIATSTKRLLKKMQDVERMVAEFRHVYPTWERILRHVEGEPDPYPPGSKSYEKRLIFLEAQSIDRAWRAILNHAENLRGPIKVTLGEPKLRAPNADFHPPDLM